MSFSFLLPLNVMLMFHEINIAMSMDTGNTTQLESNQGMVKVVPDIQVTQQSAISISKKDLHLMHIWSKFGPVHLDLNVDFAASMINERNDVLRDYQLVIHHKLVGQRSIGEAMRAFIDLITESPSKVMLIGPTYTTHAKVLAEVTNQYNLVEMAFSVTSPLLSDIDRYPLFTRTIESTSMHNPAINAVLDFYNWKKVAKIVQESDYVLITAQQFQQLMDHSNMTTVSTVAYSSDPLSQLRHTQESKAKIIVSFFNADFEIRPWCKVYQAGYFGLGVQWLHWSGRHGLISYIENTLVDDFNDGCTHQQVLEAMEGVLFFTPEALFEESSVPRGIHGYEPHTLRELYSNWSMRQHGVDSILLYPNAYDAVWACALALNETVDTLPERTALENFTYKERFVADHIYEELLNIDFLGLSGRVTLDKLGDRISPVIISQVQDGRAVTVGEYDSMTGYIHWDQTVAVRFKGGRPPRDSVRVRRVWYRTDRGVYVPVGALCVIGLVLCVICVGFNVRFARNRIVKLSSPRVNTLIAVGCAMSYTAVLVAGADSVGAGGGTFCQARVWLLVFGFTAAFGGMFAKTWRVHVLFTNTDLTRKVVKDYHLFGLIGIVALVDVIIMATWTLVDPLQWTLVNLPQFMSPTDDSTLLQPVVAVCRSHHAVYWSGTIYVFKAILLVFGIFFAWETRHVHIEALNDSKQIGMCVYNVMVMSLVAVPLINLLSVSQIDISFGVMAVAVILCATTTLGLVFFTKMHAVRTKGSQISDVLPFARSTQAASSLAPPSELSTHIARRTTVNNDATRMESVA